MLSTGLGMRPGRWFAVHNEIKALNLIIGTTKGRADNLDKKEKPEASDTHVTGPFQQQMEEADQRHILDQIAKWEGSEEINHSARSACTVEYTTKHLVSVLVAWDQGY